MDKDPDGGRRRQVVGSVKELIGKLIGDKEIEAEGAREKSGRPDASALADLPRPDPDRPDSHHPSAPLGAGQDQPPERSRTNASARRPAIRKASP